ncbi:MULTISPECIES: ABC transporter ATP-binding protein [Psychroflexus]|uniref:Iron complex transport system ATP-binding protein n=1 Tax=Psychroflexus halocasei TaxID=908615 RepID=A0A1H3YX50_9FLAO|nr:MULTISPECIES: ABC transporter ATP-binding protein [Psychroflexus]PJX24429.1 ABC transporter ATP-binding protein [Psychroflexus sp. S27]SEA15622.1 iron complex transport system ATP-binding protein [Psychroflexus halocasei]
MEKIILDIQNLDIGYDKTLVENINFSIKNSELVGLIGVNGSGKSTLLKSITQINSALKGNIILNQKPIEKYSLKEKSEQMGLVLTNPIINKDLSVFEIVALGRQPYTNWLGLLTKKDKRIIIKAIEQVGLIDKVKKKCAKLSDGQLQKVMLARALAQQTELIVLDEPTTHLDMYHKIYILKLLKMICQKNNKAMLFATHEINLALQLCDKIIVLNDKKAYFGTTEELAKNQVFKKLFPNDLINFDQEQLIFKV